MAEFNDATKAFWRYLVGAKIGVSEINNETELRNLMELDGIAGEIKLPIAESVVLAPLPTGGDDKASLQTFLTDNAGKTIALRPNSTYLVSAPIIPSSGTRLEMQNVTITATSATYQPVFDCSGVVDFSVVGGKFVWAGKAYTESNTVYPASLIRTTSTSKNISLLRATVLNFPGPALYATDSDGIRVSGCTIIGVGIGGVGTFAFNASVSKDNAGIIVDGACKNVFITDNEISYTAQGILGGQGTSTIHINGNTIHDIGGQHGVYLNQVVGAEISSNVVRNTQAAGIKVQTQSGAPDCVAVAITGNSIDTVAANGIIFTCASNAVPSRHRQVSITGNTIRNASNDGIVLEFVEGGVCTGNIVDTARAGIRVTDFIGVSVKSNRVSNTSQDGILIQSLVFSSSQASISGNDITNPATANAGASEFGIRVAEGAGLTTTDIVIDSNRIVDFLGNVRYLIYTSTASQASISYRNNHGFGATDYGHRGPATQVREWITNNLAGTLGRFYSLPLAESIGDPFLNTWSTAAPVAGTWVRGDRCWNTSPAASGTPGWVCVASGTPGTWKAMSNLSA